MSAMIIAFPHGNDPQSEANKYLSLKIYDAWEGFDTVVLTDFRTEIIPAPCKYCVYDIQDPEKQYLVVEEFYRRCMEFVRKHKPHEILVLCIEDIKQSCFIAFEELRFHTCYDAILPRNVRYEIV